MLDYVLLQLTRYCSWTWILGLDIRLDVVSKRISLFHEDLACGLVLDGDARLCAYITCIR